MSPQRRVASVGQGGRRRRALAAFAAAVTAGVLLLAPVTARADDADVAKVEALQRDAMTAFDQLDFERAQALLDQAVDVAGSATIPAQVRARTYIDLGVVAAAGHNDYDAAVRYFTVGLGLDPRAEVPQGLGTPEVLAAFDDARTLVPPPPASAAPTEPRAGETPAGASTERRRGTWFARLGVGLSAGYIPKGARTADGAPPLNHTDAGGAVYPFQSDPRYQGYASPTRVQPNGAPAVCNPGSSDGTPDPDGAPRDASCDVRLTDSGLLPTFDLDLTVGYWLSERLGLALRVRGQPHAGHGTLTHAGFGLRGLYALTPARARGFDAAMYAGFDVGQLQLQPDQGTVSVSNPDTSKVETVRVKRPFLKTSLFSMHLGVTLGWHLTQVFGLYVEVGAGYFIPPNGMFVFDAHGGPALRF
ncbi:MAG: hypothetical protein KC543_00995 [Myxococcales bacterium]|nr:hypothetical protein [Myxococcales bacterium]